MPSPIITIPFSATQQEVRCDCLHMRNNLGVKLPDDPTQITLELLASKYRLTIDRVLEPQDASGNPVGEPVRAPSPCEPPLADILTRIYTRADGTTFSGLSLLADIQTLTDAHKADGLLA